MLSSGACSPPPQALGADAAIIGDEVPYFVESQHPYPEGSPPGQLVWAHTIIHPGSSGIWIHFATLDLAIGDWVIVRSADGLPRDRFTYRGPNDVGSFWTRDADGEQATVEIWSAGTATSSGVVIDRYAWRYPATPGGMGINILGGTPRVPVPEEPRSGNSICGGDDMEDVICAEAMYPAAADHSRSVARVIFFDGTRVRSCTGSLIGCDGLFLTALHCLDTWDKVASAYFDFSFEADACGSNLRRECIPPEPCTFWNASDVPNCCDDNLDYRLLRIPGNPEAWYGHLQVERARVPFVGEPIYIPQHPEGEYKQLGLHDTFWPDNDVCFVVSTTEDYCGFLGVGALGTSCDTQNGSSGSPWVAGGTNRIIGLHVCAGCGPSWNQATPILDILADNPFLWDVPETTGLRLSKVSDPAIDLRLAWEPNSWASSYHVYRGTVGVLPPGQYDHRIDPILGIGACGITDTFTVFVGEAEFGDGTGDFYYLVTALNDCAGEGPYGVATINGVESPAVPRPPGYPCGCCP